MTILDNSLGTYDSKYKEVCDLLKTLFSRHLKQYGHIRHTQVSRVKHTIPKLNWKTKENFHDCGIFTMLHMETFDGGPASNLDCGLPVESQLQRDMLRKMLELAKEFDKRDPIKKMAIIVNAFKKREERRREIQLNTGTVVEGNQAEECEIMSTPENITQWLDKNVDLVGEGDLFGDNLAILEAMNQEITPEKLPTQKSTPGLWLDANVIDCWGTVLNHEESFRAAESKSKHFFPTGCISKSMFDGTLASFDAKWESFSNQVNAQFKGNKGGLALGGIDLRDMLRRLRFKFAIKILLHEINVHVGKMLELAKEFDKTYPVEKMAIIVDAFKKNGGT
ncbi:ulp1 protease family, C-terminal catalytic domain-containing protein [Tanacetum coccineum]|uniref:Ulp1 protease family, C-terminal catalytic domain-containing protein n=1 Tax=Tanacetum coccineum TaxID=301880 RepID=A0ABQ5J9F4_9ASTR